eukprot:TRINITY_DN1556_c0_g1_i1.p1 TRINITY_DN1556_c0_g1~~TRINITY_DN1556_c0_g1_i1.p1  ORF type:complete len:1121 (-),score=225.22 TRINITY_DN1556_c0_g1_i1:59-3421(-)
MAYEIKEETIKLTINPGTKQFEGVICMRLLPKTLIASSSSTSSTSIASKVLPLALGGRNVDIMKISFMISEYNEIIDIPFIDVFKPYEPVEITSTFSNVDVSISLSTDETPKLTKPLYSAAYEANCANFTNFFGSSETNGESLSFEPQIHHNWIDQVNLKDSIGGIDLLTLRKRLSRYAEDVHNKPRFFAEIPQFLLTENRKEFEPIDIEVEFKLCHSSIGVFFQDQPFKYCYAYSSDQFLPLLYVPEANRKSQQCVYRPRTFRRCYEFHVTCPSNYQVFTPGEKISQFVVDDFLTYIYQSKHPYVVSPSLIGIVVAPLTVLTKKMNFGENELKVVAACLPGREEHMLLTVNHLIAQIAPFLDVWGRNYFPFMQLSLVFLTDTYQDVQTFGGLAVINERFLVSTEEVLHLTDNLFSLLLGPSGCFFPGVYVPYDVRDEWLIIGLRYFFAYLVLVQYNYDELGISMARGVEELIFKAQCEIQKRDIITTFGPIFPALSSVDGVRDSLREIDLTGFQRRLFGMLEKDESFGFFDMFDMYTCYDLLAKKAFLLLYQVYNSYADPTKFFQEIFATLSKEKVLLPLTTSNFISLVSHGSSDIRDLFSYWLLYHGIPKFDICYVFYNKRSERPYLAAFRHHISTSSDEKQILLPFKITGHYSPKLSTTLTHLPEISVKSIFAYHSGNMTEKSKNRRPGGPGGPGATGDMPKLSKFDTNRIYYMTFDPEAKLIADIHTWHGKDSVTNIFARCSNYSLVYQLREMKHTLENDGLVNSSPMLDLAITVMENDPSIRVCSQIKGELIEAIAHSNDESHRLFFYLENMLLYPHSSEIKPRDLSGFDDLRVMIACMKNIAKYSAHLDFARARLPANNVLEYFVILLSNHQTVVDFFDFNFLEGLFEAICSIPMNIVNSNAFADHTTLTNLFLLVISKVEDLFQFIDHPTALNTICQNIKAITHLFILGAYHPTVDFSVFTKIVSFNCNSEVRLTAVKGFIRIHLFNQSLSSQYQEHILNCVDLLQQLLKISFNDHSPNFGSKVIHSFVKMCYSKTNKVNSNCSQYLSPLQSVSLTSDLKQVINDIYGLIHGGYCLHNMHLYFGLLDLLQLLFGTHTPPGFRGQGDAVVDLFY